MLLVGAVSASALLTPLAVTATPSVNHKETQKECTVSDATYPTTLGSGVDFLDPLTEVSAEPSDIAKSGVDVPVAVPDGNGGLYRASRGGKGEVSHVGGSSPSWVAKLGRSEDSPPFPNPYKLVLSDKTLYILGSFDTVNGKKRHDVAAVNADTGELLPWDPKIRNGLAYKIAVTSDRVFISVSRDEGKLSIGGKRISNKRSSAELFAVDTSAGKLLAWTPQAKELKRLNMTMAIASSEDKLYLAVSDEDSLKDFFIALDTATGKRLNWGGKRIKIDREIGDLTVAGDRVYIDGDFRRVNGKLRAGAAAVSAATGKLLDWSPDVYEGADIFTDIRPVGDRVYGTAIGTFHQAVALSADTGEALPWKIKTLGDNSDLLAATEDVVYVQSSSNSCNAPMD